MLTQQTSTAVGNAGAGGIKTGPLWTLRVVATLFLLSVLVQAVSAGQLMDGTASMRALHEFGAMGTVTLGLVQLIAAVLVRRPGGGPSGPAWLSLVVLLSTVGQFMAGDSHIFAVHVPLAVVLGLCAAWLVAWSWATRP